MKTDTYRMIQRIVACFLPVTLLLLIVSAVPCDAQSFNDDPEPDATISIAPFYQFEQFDALIDPASLTGIGGTEEERCGQFVDGRGRGIGGAINLSLRLNENVAVDAGVGMISRKSVLDYFCVDPAEIRMPDGSTELASTRHVFDADRLSLFLTAGVRLYPISTQGLYAGIGGQVQSDFSESYQLHEDIISPVSAYFVDGGGQRRYYGEGSIEPTGPVPGVILKVGYELPAGTSFVIGPEVSYSIFLSTESNLGKLRSNTFRIGLNIGHTFRLLPVKGSTPLEPGK